MQQIDLQKSVENSLIQALGLQKVRADAFSLHIEVPHLALDPYGTWTVPAWCGASPAARKSYELHRLLQDIEKHVADNTGQIVTIDLQPTRSGN